MALAALLCVGAYEGVKEIDKQQTFNEAMIMIEAYDINHDGVITEDEQIAFTEDMYKKYGDEQFSAGEVEAAINEAQTLFSKYDVNGDGVLSYDEKMNIVYDVMEAYDNGLIPEGDFKTFVAGYDEYVNTINGYTALLDEVGVPGESFYLDIRRGE